MSARAAAERRGAAGTRDLRLLALAVGLSAAGDMIALITLSLRVHDLTGSAFAVSALFGATMLPIVALAPLGGRLADRVESTRVLLAASVAQAVVAAGLAFVDPLAAILALTALLTAGAAIAQPAEFALVPAMATPERLAAAGGRMEAARYAGFTAGPLLAAGLVALGGTQLALLVNAASFTAVALAAAAMRTRRHPEPHAIAHEDKGAGLRSLLGDRVLRPVVLAAVGALLFISACMTAEVFYVKDVLGAGDAGYAAMFAAWTLGMVFGALALPQRVPPAAMATVALLALALQGAGMAAQTAWAVLPAALAGWLVGGVGHGLKNALVRTVIAQRVASAAHGRAFAAYNAARNAAELGALGAGGALVGVLGARNALVLAGLGPVVAALLGLAALRHERPQQRQRRFAPRLQPSAHDA
jgi:Na+/melibiose symporter-like transporter